MPRWTRIARGMFGTGITFAVGVGAVSSLVGVTAMLFGELTLIELAQSVVRMSVVSFILGVAFSGLLALIARGRSLEKLSLPLVTALGAAGGLSYWLFLAMNGGRTWEPRVALLNFVLLVVMGSGAAAGTLLVARRAKQALSSDEDTPLLRDRLFDEVTEQLRSEREAHR
jgi:hypothetical protein